MKVRDTNLFGVKLVIPDRFEDHRGSYMEIYDSDKFRDVTDEQFVQDDFPIPVSEIVLIEDAHTAVSRGCLSEAQLIEDEIEDEEESDSEENDS